MKDFAVNSSATALKPRSTAADPQEEAVTARMALRRLRPALPVRVMMHASEPAVLRDRNSHYEVEAAYGPWRSAGCWWSERAWDEEEWDVLASRENGSPLLCLLIHDLKQNAWRIEALYD